MPVWFWIFSFYVVVIHITLYSGFFVWLEQHNIAFAVFYVKMLIYPLPPNSLLVEPCSLLFIQMNVDNDRTHIPNLWPEIVHNRYTVRGLRLKKKTTVCLSLDCMLILLLMVTQSCEACWIPVFTADNTTINQFKKTIYFRTCNFEYIIRAEILRIKSTCQTRMNFIKHVRRVFAY